MFGMRTPAKRQPSASRTPPSNTGERNVRLSIGEWEAAGTDTTSASTKACSAGQPVQQQKPVTTSKVSDKTFVRTPTSPKRWPAGRLGEARACLNKGKLNLENSRNLKTEIKLGVTEALDRLYALVKEAEADLKKTKPAPETKVQEETGLKETLNAPPKPPNPDQIRLVATLEEHSRLLTENNEKLMEIQNRLENQRELLERVTTESYATVTARKSPSRSALHSVVVTSKDEAETGEEVLNKIRHTIDAKEGWVKVERIRKARDRKVIMGFGSKAERDKVKDRLGKDSPNLTVEDMKNRDPLLVLKGVLAANSDEDIAKALRNQNKDVFHGLDGEGARIVVKYRRKARNPHTNHVVISTSPVVWQRALDLGSLHIDLQRVKVEDQSPLIQCTRCLGYGHGKRLCKETTDLCSHCGGPHMRAECPDMLLGIPPKCKNCTKAGHEQSEHNAFSDECPTRKRWDAIARSTVAYC